MSERMVASGRFDIVQTARPLEDPGVLRAIGVFGFTVRMLVWVRRLRRMSRGG